MVNSTTPTLPLTDSVSPTDQEALAAAVAEAYQAGTPVYPIGGDTSADYGVLPTQPGLGLSLSRLGRVIDYPAKDLTITVEAGITMAELAKRLAAGRQRLPVDVPQAQQATLGGVVATAAAGSRRFRWGTLRDYCIGIRAVDGQGTPFSSGGRVVKNAAGYNIGRLLTGSLGTLGVITQVTLMVKPVPETSALVACDIADFDVARRLLSELVNTQTLPSAIELLAGPAWQDDPVLGRPSDAAKARLVVGFEGTQAEVDWMISRLTDEWGQSDVTSPVAIRDAQARRLWDRLAEFPASQTADKQTPDKNGGRVGVEIRTQPSALVDTVEQVIGVDPDCSIQAHAGNGILRARFSLDAGELAAKLNDPLRSALRSTGGSLVVSSHPRDSQFDRQTVWGPPADGMKVMQSIKSQFDPKGILNPGRFIY